MGTDDCRVWIIAAMYGVRCRLWIAHRRDAAMCAVLYWVVCCGQDVSGRPDSGTRGWYHPGELRGPSGPPRRRRAVLAHFINHFTCDAAAWPKDREGEIGVWKKMVGDADQLVDKDSPVIFTGWISNTEGYVLLEADTKAEVIGVCARFWPYFHNDIMEIVPTAEAGPAILAGAIAGWERQ